jgi:Mn-dependent DtxR family transcriptional regulator/Fe2+ transport system protein FeoA
MCATDTLSANLEDYLEAIYRIVQEDRVARVKDIAARLNVQKASVSGALQSLAAKGLVNHEPYSYITLTPRGETIAREVFHRHQVLTGFLTDFLGINPETADRNACHIEHAIEPIVLDRLIEFVQRTVAAVPLTAVAAGRGGTVVRVDGGEALVGTLHERGLTPGTPVEVEAVGPDGSVSVKVGGQSRSLSRPEAAAVLVARPRGPKARAHDDK